MSNNHCLVPARFFLQQKLQKEKILAKKFPLIDLSKFSIFPLSVYQVLFRVILETLPSMRFGVYREETKLEP